MKHQPILCPGCNLPLRAERIAAGKKTCGRRCMRVSSKKFLTAWLFPARVKPLTPTQTRRNTSRLFDTDGDCGATDS